MTAATPRTLNAIAADIRAALAAVEAAPDDASAAASFARLKALIEEQLSRTESLKTSYYKLKDAAPQTEPEEAEQPHGSPAPSQSGDFSASLTATFPDVLTVESAPNCLFCRLSFGFVNLLQIALLDVKAKQLYLTSGAIRNLEPADTKALLFHLKMYTAK
jgi:hypothetical protein